MKKAATIFMMAVLGLFVWVGFSVPLAQDAEKFGDAGELTVSRTIFNLAKRLPSVWAMRVKAGAVARSLPDYPREVSTPSAEVIYGWIEGLCSTPHRRPGTPEGHLGELWVRDRLVELGLAEVRMDPIEVTVWEAEQWSFRVGGEEIPSFYILNTGFTPDDGLTAPLVFVGEGAASDFDRVDVRGRIVVADTPYPYLPTGLILKFLGASYAISDPDGWITATSGQWLNFVRLNFTGQFSEETAPPTDVYWNARKRGAAGIVLILRDQPSGEVTQYGPYDGIMKPLPGLYVGKFEGDRLRELARAGAEATLTLTGSKTPGVMHNVWGVLPGRSDEVILVTSHHDAPFQGAVEDGAGVAQVLAQVWAWSRVPEEERPRTLVFVINSGHFYGSLGAHRFARDHEDIMRRAKILLTLEHLGAKEVEEEGRAYAETGRLALTVMFTSPDPTVAGAVRKAFNQKPPPITVSIPADLFGEAPTSDAAGYVIESGVPVISWIGCPYYLLDAQDTLDKIDINSLEPIAASVTEIVKIYMAMP